ncbi:MAG: hypothetical protein JRI95_10640 [Deltaproteobacteria bacterium]|nr:hypothetical protein [Deltaproteobacteria bacterium]
MKDQQIQLDIWGVIRRRNLGFLLIFLPVLVAFVVTALLLPAVYRSQTTILIEGQQIPTEYVRTTVTSYVEERLEIIKQRVLSRTKLIDIITKLNLYPDMRKQHTWGEIVAKMRKDISIKTISAEVGGGRGGARSATIAFMLLYEGRRPSQVQKVANVLASLYLEENIRTRERRAATTTQYLQDELKSVKKELNNIEQKISKLKIEHLGELPEYTEVNLSALGRLNRDRDQINMRIHSLQEREVYLKAQLALLDSQISAVDEKGNPIDNPREHLKKLESTLLAMKAELSDKHPDVKRLKRQIRELEVQVQKTDNSRANPQRLQELQSQLTELKAKYGPKHPDVLRKTREIQSLTRGDDSTGRTDQKVDNPALVNLRVQVESTRMEIENLVKERVKVKERIEMYQKRIEMAPLVEREYNSLLRDHEHTNRRYSEIMHALAEAKAAQALEETQRSERFTIIEPAHLPEKPYKPDRVAIVLVGLVLAVGAGAGFAGIRESMDNTVKTADELTYLTGLPLLSVLPLVKTDKKRRATRLKIIALLGAVIVVIAIGLLLVHIFVTPLDILWIKIQKRLML